MPAERTIVSWWRRVDPGVVLWLLAAPAVWGAHGFQDGLSRDAALYVYAGQEVADGAAPYVEVLNRAGPLAHLLPGLGVELARWVGIGDVVGARWVSFVLVAATPALVYVLARDTFGSRLAGSVGAATLLAFPGLALLATDGPQSKLPMMLGLVVGLVLLAHRRWLTAGLVTGLATLTWQPVLVVLVAAALTVAALMPGDRRDRLAGVARFAAGGALALAATVAYFLLSGAFDAFVEGFWGVNAGYTDQRGLTDRPGWAWDALTAWLGWTTGLLVVGCGLSVALALRALRRGRPPSADGTDVVALGAATVAGVGWSMTAFNGAPDALLVMPLAAAGIGGGVALAAEWFPGARHRVWHRSLTVVAGGWVLVALAATLHLTWTDRAPELAAERLGAEAAFDSAPDGATVFVFDAPQPLALTGRSSVSRYVLFGAGMKDYVASQWADGFRGYILRLRELQPTLVITPPRGLAGALRPLDRDYVEVEGGDGWRAFLSEDAVQVPVQVP